MNTLPTPSVVVEELLPCPFCAHNDELQIAHIGAADEWWFEVFCDYCCTYGPTAQTEAEATAAWNTRVAASDRDVLVAALTPSAETKAAYIGEFSFTIEDTDDEWGLPITRRVEVPWTTIKKIMAAIRTRAALVPLGGGATTLDSPRESST